MAAETNMLRLSARVDVAAAAGADGAVNVSILAYSGAQMDVPGWGPLVLELSGIDIAGKIPLLVDHLAELASVAGHGQARIEAGALMVKGQILPVTEAGKMVAGLAKAGFPWQASVGVEIKTRVRAQAGELLKANGKAFKAGERGLTHVTAGLLKEVSIVPLGADPATSVSVTAAKGKTMPPEIDIDLNEVPDPVVAERQRVTKICTALKGRHPEIQAKAIADGWTAEAAELHALRASRPSAPAPGLSGMAADTGAADVLEASMCLSAGLSETFVAKHYDEQTMNVAMSKPHRGAGIQAAMLHVMHAAGKHAPGHRVDTDFIRTAVDANLMLRASGFSTLSLPGILSNVANKFMLGSYEAVPTTWQLFCAIRSNVDFKQAVRYRLTGTGAFEEVAPTGEIKHMSLTDEQSYESTLKTHGKMIGITRTDIINDDLDALSSIPKMLGRMSAIAVEKAVYTLLLLNTGSFFSTGNGNYDEGADTALSLAALTLAEALFLDQVDGNSDPVMITPRTLLVPTSLKTTGRSLMQSIDLIGSTTANVPLPSGNPWKEQFTLGVSPWLNGSLSGASEVAWYLFGAPGDVAAMAVCFLNGVAVPTIETNDAEFSTLGIQMRAFHDFTAAFEDPRAAVKMKGEV